MSDVQGDGLTGEQCDHGKSPLTGTEYNIVVVYTRPWYAPWRKVYWRRCWLCDLREPVQQP